MESILDQPQSSNSKKSIDEVLQNGYNISIGDAWSRATEIWKKNIGGFLLYTILGILILLVVACVPVIGIIADIFVMGPAFIAGFYFVASKISTGNITNKDYSSGFKKNSDNAKYMMVLSLGYILVYSPMIIYFLLHYKIIMAALLEAQADHGFMAVNYISSSFESVVWYVRGLSLLFTIASIFLILVLPLINLDGLDAISAIKLSINIVSKKFWSFVLVTLVVALINLCGILFCCIGLLFTFSISYCFYYAIYEQIFKDKTIDQS